jgi:hypothetical protein
MDTIFGGVQWSELALDDVKTFLAVADDEPLLWEAKGAGADAHHVRKTVCAFANSHDGGYLIVGAEETSTGFELSGREFDREPHLWVTDAVRDGVRPWPGVDSRVFAVDGGRHVVVVWTPPMATPPCITRGTVYERVPGASVPVKDAVRLAELYRRGDEAQRTAIAFAARASNVLIDLPDLPLDDAALVVGFALAIRATGYRDLDLSSHLFSRSFTAEAESQMSTLPVGQPVMLGMNSYADWSQAAITWHRQPQSSHAHRWLVRATWDGAVAVRWTMATDAITARSVVATPLTHAWNLALRLICELGATSSYHASLRLFGKPFVDLSEVPSEDHIETLPAITRGPLPLDGVTTRTLDSVEREINRVLGEVVYEPDAS